VAGPAEHTAPFKDAGLVEVSEAAEGLGILAGPARDAAPAPPVLIHIDPAVSGGPIHDRFDAQIRGRVASPAVIEEVELETDGTVVARAVFGQPPRTEAMADGTPVRHRAFHLILARPRDVADAPCLCLIRARTSDGHSHTEALDLVIDQAAPQPVMVRSGPVLAGLGHTGGLPQIVLYVERAMLDSGGNLAVHGWALAMTPIVTVQVFADGHERLPAAKLGGQRDDVANAYPAYPNARVSGYACNGRIDQSAGPLDAIRVQAISTHGFATEVIVPVEHIGPRPSARPLAERRQEAPPSFSPFHQKPTYQLTADVSIAPALLPSPAQSPLAPTGTLGVLPRVLEPQPVLHVAAPQVPKPQAPEPQPQLPQDNRREIHYFCDDAIVAPDGTLGVEGWAVCAIGITGVSIYLGREKLGDSELGLPRPDVGEEHATIPMARLAGFRFRKHLPDLVEGEHGVRIVVRNGLDDIRDETKVVTFRPANTPRPALAEAPTHPAQTTGVSEFRFELDSPQVMNDAVQESVTGRLTIEGWVLARSGVIGLEVFLDDQRLGEAHYGLARQDVGAAFPDWENALRSGYAFHCPPRSLRDGAHTVRLVVRARNGLEMVRSFTIEVKKTEDDDSLASIRRRMSKAEANVLAAVLDDLDHHPGFRLILRQSGAPVPEQLRVTIDSLTRQAYADWRLVVLTDADDEVVAGLRDLVAGFAGERAERISVIGPSDAAFDAMLGTMPSTGAEAGQVLFGMLCPGDELAVDAFAEIALAGGLHRAADLLYADEACVSPASHEREPFFKPDFSPDLLLSTNYIGRPWFATAALLRRVAVTPRALLRDGEYDLVLRCTEQAEAVRHIPKLLAQRGTVALDDDATGRAALAAAAVRRGIDADVVDGCLPGTWRFRRMSPATGKVAIIIPTCAAHGYIENCIATLRSRTAYRNYEIVCVDNIPDSQMAWKVWLQQSADRIVDIPEAFNWSRFNNLAAAATDSEYLLFLNDDIEIAQNDWLDVLLEHAQRPEVGIVGPQLLYPSGKVQHAGMFLGAGIGRHAFRFAPAEDPGYFGLALTQRNVIAVTGACMLMRREFFEENGRFDEAHSVINNDLDFCLRAHRAGKLTVFTPHASLIHHELASRERLPDVFDTAHFNSRWKTLFAAGDPYFSPLLSRYSDDYRPDDEAVQTVFAAHPLFDAEEIRRILVVKLDHIGDFVTGLPAMRRLKTLFPHASITVLAGRHARGFASMEPAIDELIEFDFFHARSQLGEKELTKDDFLELRAQLAPYRFDLAVDLRKHLSTRDVLQYTGARILAGYDYMGQFPFLDIALEWEGDKTLQRKRSHIVDDLLALVETIATACGTDRSVLPVPLEKPDPETLPDAVRALFDKPVVAMHIGAGNITKTWPAEYFSALIDLLTERNGVNVMLIGGPDEREASEALLETLLRPDAVASVAGQTALSDLPRLLAACCLYIGNDSGPKHIAAALGIPTIGIHSGVVDANEWGPVGRRAVALRRDMTCSPCYLAKAEDCPRALACLRHLEPSMVHQTASMLLARPVSWAASDTPTETTIAAVLKEVPGDVGEAPELVEAPDEAMAAAEPAGKAGSVAEQIAQGAAETPPESATPGAAEAEPAKRPIARLSTRPKAKPSGRGRRVRA
jgi:ADP-heptose:LPS heptosyltransferase/GT2 family glycosyltransferase